MSSKIQKLNYIKSIVKRYFMPLINIFNCANNYHKDIEKIKQLEVKNTELINKIKRLEERYET